MDREFELRNLTEFELLLLLLAFLSNDVRECVNQRSLGSLFMLLSGQQGGVTRMLLHVSWHRVTTMFAMYHGQKKE